VTHEKLEKLYQEGKATLPVNQVNHREYVYNGVRYFCGYDSTRNPKYVQRTWQDPQYAVNGWLCYKQETERD
jgi:hypothetical protein